MVSLSRTLSLGLFLVALGLSGASGQEPPKDEPPAQRVEPSQPPEKPKATAQSNAKAADIRVSPEKPKATQQEANRAQPERREGLPFGTFADWVIVIFTGALTWVAIKQHKLETKLAEDTGQSITLAKQSADAATEGVKAAQALAAAAAASSLVAREGLDLAQERGRQELRPYVSIVPLSIALERGEIIQAQLSLRNMGDTPAKNVRVKRALRVLPFPLVDDPPDVDSPAPEQLFALWKDDERATFGAQSDVVFDEAIIQRTLTVGARECLYLFASVTYTDVFGDEHWTRCCHYVEPKLYQNGVLMFCAANRYNDFT